MQYSKLKELARKKWKFERMFTVILIAMIVLLFLGFSLLEIGYYTNPVSLMSCAMFVSLCIVVFLICERKQYKYIRATEDYIIIKIMDLINENGIDTNNFEVVQEMAYGYRVGFHNQTVDYEDLQSKIDNELATMNKISGVSIRVKLI